MLKSYCFFFQSIIFYFDPKIPRKSLFFSRKIVPNLSIFSTKIGLFFFTGAKRREIFWEKISSRWISTKIEVFFMTKIRNFKKQFDPVYQGCDFPRKSTFLMWKKLEISKINSTQFLSLVNIHENRFLFLKKIRNFKNKFDPICQACEFPRKSVFFLEKN